MTSEHTHPSAQAPDGFDSPSTPEQLVAWLEAKHARHGEAEDLQAAQLLRQLPIQQLPHQSVSSPSLTPENNERAIVAGAKKQAKRLLKLTKESPLQLTALNQALEVVAKLHGYPHWQAMATSVPSLSLASDAPLSGKAAALQNAPTLASKATPTHPSVVSHLAYDPLDPLAAFSDPQDLPAGTRILTSNFQALQEKWKGHKGVQFFSVSDQFQLPFLCCPLGSTSMLPKQVSLFLHTMRTMGELGVSFDTDLRMAIEQAFGRAKNATLRFLVEDGNAGGIPVPNLSRKAKALLKKLPEDITAVQASWRLVEAGLMADAWVCHVAWQPTLTDLQHTSAFPSASRLLDLMALLRQQRSGQEPSGKLLNPSATDITVFEVDPLELDSGTTSAGRWALSHYLTTLMLPSKAVVDLVSNLPTTSYTHPENNQWLASIPASQRSSVVAFHEEQARQMADSLLWLDALDDPLRSETVLDLVKSLADVSQQQSRRLWLSAASLPRSISLFVDEQPPTQWQRMLSRHRKNSPLF